MNPVCNFTEQRTETPEPRARKARPPTAVVVANLGERVYVSPQVRDPALATTTTLTPLRTIKKFPEETFQGAHVSLKKENSNSDGVSSVVHLSLIHI